MVSHTPSQPTNHHFHMNKRRVQQTHPNFNGKLAIDPPLSSVRFPIYISLYYGGSNVLQPKRCLVEGYLLYSFCVLLYCVFLFFVVVNDYYQCI